MAWSLVGHTSAHGATTSAIDTTGADLLIVAVSSYSTTPVTVSDSKSNTWTALTERANSNLHHRLFYCQGGTVGSAHTFSTNANFYGIAVAAFSGSTSSPLDQTTGATASAQTIQPGSITPLSDNQLVVTSMGQGADLAGSGTDTWTVGSSYAISDFIDAKSGSYDGVGIAWIAQTSAAATNPQWDSARGTQQLAAIIASFKPAAGGGGGLSVTPGQGALKITGQAPSVSVSQKQSVSPGKGALALTGFAPRLRNSSLDISKAPAAGALKFTGFAPTVTITAGRTIAPNAAGLVITGKAPTVSKTAKWFTAPGQAAIVINGFPPSVSVQAASPKFVPASASIVLTGFAPTVVNSGDVTLARAQTVAGGRRPRERYALTYKGEMLVFDTMQALYDWFLALDDRETQGVKKKQSAMPSESFWSARQSPRSSLRRSRSEVPIQRSGTRLPRSRSMFSVNTTRP